MSSVAAQYSQVAPFKCWIATADFYLYSKTGAVTTVQALSGVVLTDMGKTQFATAPVAPATAGAVLRKVAILPFPASPSVKVGYIYLSDAVPAAQKAVALN